ncbi:MAG: hypothetical protein RSB78_01985 [Oscillospiraceae bacterium]
MNYKKLFSAVTAVAVCLCMFTSCGYNPETVMKIDGDSVSAGKYLYYQLESTFKAVTTNNDPAIADASILDIDIEGTPAREWIAAQSLNMLKQNVFIDREFKRLDLAMDDFNKYYIEYQASNDWNNYGSMYMKNGIGYETFIEMQTVPYKQSMVIQKLYGADGEFAFSAEEKQANFVDNYTRIDYIVFPSTNISGSKLDSENLAKIGEVAALMAQAKTDEELKALYTQHYAEVLTLTGSNSEVNDEQFTKLFIKDTFVNTNTDGINSDLVKAAIATADSDLHLFEKDGTYYIYRNKGLSAEDTEETNDMAVVTAMGSGLFQEYMEKSIVDYKVDADARAQKYYALDKIKFK